MTLRRLCLAGLLVSNHLTAQLFFYRIVLVFSVIYVGHVRSKWDHKSELAQEFFLLLSSTILPVYTDYVTDPRARFTMGWVSSGIFCT